MSPTEPGDGDDFPLTADHRMLLQMRDTLYEGNWSDFVRDLRARAEDQPHVFDTIPETPGMKDTITYHLTLIDQMQAWEIAHQQTLSADKDT